MKNKFNIPLIYITSSDKNKRQEEMDYRNCLVNPNFIQHYEFFSINNKKEIHYTRFTSKRNTMFIKSGFDIVKITDEK